MINIDKYVKAFENSYSTEIELNELKETRSILKFTGKYPKSKPLTHYDFIELIMNKLNNASIEYVCNPIYVSKKEAYFINSMDIIFSNVITSFTFPAFSNDEHQLTIAIAYTDKGITVACGTQIRICSNQTILGQGNFMTTFGSDSMPYNELITIFDLWLTKLEEKWTYYNKAIDLFKRYLINTNDIKSIIGALHIRAVQKAYLLSDMPPVFNISEMTQFSKGILSSNLLDLKENEKSLWEVYNIGTEIISHEESNLTERIKLTINFGTFIIDLFNINALINSDNPDTNDVVIDITDINIILPNSDNNNQNIDNEVFDIIDANIVD